jgi:hypothetical protein
MPQPEPPVDEPPLVTPLLVLTPPPEFVPEDPAAADVDPAEVLAVLPPVDEPALEPVEVAAEFPLMLVPRQPPSAVTAMNPASPLSI